VVRLACVRAREGVNVWGVGGEHVRVWGACTCVFGVHARAWVCAPADRGKAGKASRRGVEGGALASWGPLCMGSCEMTVQLPLPVRGGLWGQCQAQAAARVSGAGVTSRSGPLRAWEMDK
jgi:hypothetical protein